MEGPSLGEWACDYQVPEFYADSGMNFDLSPLSPKDIQERIRLKLEHCNDSGDGVTITSGPPSKKSKVEPSKPLLIVTRC